MNRSRARILVVEDDREVAAAIRAGLVQAGYAVRVAVDGVEALRVFDDERPDLVTIDLQVPTVSGYRLVQVFKRTAPTIPILIVTATPFQEAEELAKAGVAGFISKPFGLRSFVDAIEAALRRRPPLTPESLHGSN
jgi:DNA-binding response OmpR family regulator